MFSNTQCVPEDASTDGGFDSPLQDLAGCTQLPGYRDNQNKSAASRIKLRGFELMLPWISPSLVHSKYMGRMHAPRPLSTNH